ncbi:MAG: hypothetical protein ACI9XK_000371 [Granulosicoccus sp.]|jgi:hypothetical protein
MLNLPQCLHWGVPALNIVAGLMCLNKPSANQHPTMRFLLYLGAASYSLVLVSFFFTKTIFCRSWENEAVSKDPCRSRSSRWVGY